MVHLAFTIFCILLATSGCLADVSHLLQYNSHETTTTPEPSPVPYSFYYKAGRFPGNIDRFQSESSDGSGFVKGTYSFIDPKFKIRTVDYTADKSGFHPILKNFEDVTRPPKDSEAVELAKERHYALYQRIAEQNSHPAVYSSVPRDSASVESAKIRHFELFNKIAAEHQAIAAHREAERLAFQATSIPNDVNDSVVY